MKTFLSRVLVLSSVSGLLFLPSVSGWGAATPQTNGPAQVDASPKQVDKTSKRADTRSKQADNVSGRGDYTSFKVIADRNIFNNNRSRSRGDAPKPVKVESFALAGTLSYEKGTFAFFDGTSAEYRKVLKPEGTIAGYKVTEIGPNAAKLEAGDQKVEMHVGMQLRREDEGEWKLAARSDVSSSSGSRDSSGRDSGQRDDRSRFSSDRGSSSRFSGDRGSSDRGPGGRFSGGRGPSDRGPGGRSSGDRGSNGRDSGSSYSDNRGPSSSGSGDQGSGGVSREEALRRLMEQRARERQ